MGNEQSTVSRDAKLLYDKALISQEKNDDRKALSYCYQARNLIRSINGNNQDIDRLQYSITLNMCNIYERQYELTMANLLISETLEIAHKLQQQDKIAQCLDTQGKIKRLQGDYDGAILDHNKSIKIKLKLHGNEGLDVCISYSKIANVYCDQGKYDDAVRMYEKSLKIQLSALADNHPSIAQTYHPNVSQHGKCLSTLRQIC